MVSLPILFMNRKEKRDKLYTWQRPKPKFALGEMVKVEEKYIGIITSVHEKADYTRPFYLIHYIISPNNAKEEWVAENFLIKA